LPGLQGQNEHNYNTTTRSPYHPLGKAGGDNQKKKGGFSLGGDFSHAKKKKNSLIDKIGDLGIWGVEKGKK